MTYFYTDNGHVASTQLERLQRSLVILTDIFNWLFLRNIIQKTVIMVFQTCHTPGSMLVVAYDLRSMINVQDVFRILQETCTHENPTKHR